MKILKPALHVIAFILLTVITQIGGVIYLLSLLLSPFVLKPFTNKAVRFGAKVATFLLLYLAATFFIVPPVAKLFGREQLPLTETNHLQPLNVFTCILNRNYVRLSLREAAFAVAEKMTKKYPGTVINYLDGCFPFINKFPLVPHLSHNDGNKLDLAFCYVDNKTGKANRGLPARSCRGCLPPFK